MAGDLEPYLRLRPQQNEDGKGKRKELLCALFAAILAPLRKSCDVPSGK